MNRKVLFTFCMTVGLLIMLVTAGGVSAQLYSLGDMGIPDDYDQTILSFRDTQVDFDSFVEQLPTEFNWKTQGKVTKAKNQQSCGSCWAFASVGAFESKLLIKGKPTSDLSEQQQISCNTSMYGCSGGSMTALRYWETLGPMQESCTGYPSAGGSEPACSTLSGCATLAYRTMNYYTVNMASRDEIKASLYNHGPTYFRYDVYSDFNTWWNSAGSGAVYRQSSGSNLGGHAVLLIGWSDSKGAWLLKNSWGETEGPNGDGTFWMAYTGHTIDLGFGMANVEIKETKPPVIPKLVSPGGSVTDRTPAFKWNKVTNATKYRYQVYRGTTLLYTKTVSAGACGATTCSNTPVTTLQYAAHKWRAQAYVGGVWKSYSAYKSFTVAQAAAGFNSSFNGSAAGWSAVKGAWSISNGAYYRSAGLADLTASAKHTGTYGNFTYEVRMKRDGSCTGCSNRVFIRGNPTSFTSTNLWKPSYAFQYSNNGSFSVWEFTSDGASIALKEWTASTAIVQGGWNTLKVVANGTSLKYYINGSLVWSGSDSTLKTGAVGFGYYRDYYAGTFLADWAKLTVISGSEASDVADEAVLPGILVPGGDENQSP